MSRVALALFAFHFHQPPGATDAAAENALDGALAPLVSLLEARPLFRATLHLSGSLLDRAERLRPGLIDRVAALVEAGRVEMLGGGYHDPLLPLLPDADRLLQLDRMADRVERRFGVRPAGAWLAERAWDPSLIPALSAAGVEYVLLDDGHFRPLGLPPERLRGIFLAEEAGCVVRLLPSSARLRYAMPFKPVHEAAREFAHVVREALGGVILAADDGDKFGAWPGTEAARGPEGWLARFLDLALADPLLRSATCLEAVRTAPPVSRAEPPAGAYPEFLEWSLPEEAGRALRQVTSEAYARGDAERVTRFFAAGGVRNFLVKYPEADLLHKKALRVSALVEGMRKGPKRERATDLLLAAQTGDVYWHGVFPGVYDPRLRATAWFSLVEAETLAACDGKPFVAAAEEDFDFDGRPELSLENDKVCLLARPLAGAALVEFDHRPTRGNLLDVLALRREAYHDPAADGPFDWHPRAGFLDRFLPLDASADELSRGTERERGDFTLAPFRYGVRRTKGRLEASFERTGNVEGPRGLAPFSLQKRIVLLPGDEGASLEWSLRNDSMESAEFLYAVEWNFSVSGPAARVEPCPAGEEPGALEVSRRANVREFRLVDAGFGRELSFTADVPFDLLRAPVVSRHRGLTGPERALQGVCLLTAFRVSLLPAGVFRVRGRIEAAAPGRPVRPGKARP